MKWSEGREREGRENKGEQREAGATKCRSQWDDRGKKKKKNNRRSAAGWSHFDKNLKAKLAEKVAWTGPVKDFELTTAEQIRVRGMTRGQIK